MNTSEPKRDTADAHHVASDVRASLAGSDCPPQFVQIACDAAERAAALAVRAAESRERRRIVRWLKSVADVYAGRSRAGSGEDTVYWSDQLEALSQAAAAIARRRHANPH